MKSNRRDFLKFSGLTGLGILSARNGFAAGVKNLAGTSECKTETCKSGFPFATEEKAIKAGEKIGIGSARLAGPKEIEVFSFQTLPIVYTAGKAGIKPGGGIRIGIRHMCHLWNPVQNEDSAKEGYLTVATSNNAPIKVTVACKNWSKEFFGIYFPWQNVVEVIVPKPGLAAGDTITVTYGDKRKGGPGFRTQPFDESHFTFKVYVDALGRGEFLPLEKNPEVKVVAAEAKQLTAVMPSDAVVGQPTWCLVRAEDRFGNPATSYRGTVHLKSDTNAARLPDSYTFTADDRGVHRFNNIIFKSEGLGRLQVEDNNSFRDETNPVKVSVKRAENLLLWGDIHGHTLNSDGRDTPEEFYELAQRVEGLDFCAVSDHAFEMPAKLWENSKEATNKANQPGKFITFNGYEWSGKCDVGGDHNVYWLEDDPPLYRSTSYYEPRNIQMYHEEEPKVAEVKDLMDILEKRHLKDKNVFCIPHFGGRKGNPQWHNPKVQRLIEVYSEHRRSEDWMTTFLTKGYRLGIMASSDGHYGNPSYGYLKRNSPDIGDFQQEIGMALVAVYAPKRTRKSIFTALYDRHCYATTGDRILLDFQVDGHPMGSEYKTSDAPVISVMAAGTAEITSVEIKKDSKTIHKIEPHQMSVEFKWRDPDFRADKPCYYYVCINQSNNEQAISSPVWIN